MNVILVGFGVVGQGFAKILSDKADELESKYGFTANIVGVITGSKGTLYHPDGLSIPYLLEGFDADYSIDDEEEDENGEDEAEETKDEKSDDDDEDGDDEDDDKKTSKSKSKSKSKAKSKKSDTKKKTVKLEYFDHYPDSSGLKRDWDALEMIAEADADVVIEMSPTDLETGQPALEHCHKALNNNKHVILANKGPVALAFHALDEKAKESHLQFRYEATVMAGTPTMTVAQEGLAGCTIKEVRGILNGTTNYILTQMEDGMKYDDALKKAQELGYAETDPTGDVEGHDAAGKVLILAKTLFGATYGMKDLDVEGITKIKDKDIKDALKKDEHYKLIATVTAESGSVKPVRLPASDPLAGVSGANNAITISTDLMGDVTLIGAGAGQQETGFAILSDLLAIHRKTS